MTSPPTEQADEQSTERPMLGRRPLLKALSAGAALSLGSGSAVADHDVPHIPLLDSYYGYATPDADEIPANLDPDHEVELHIDLPADLEDPDQPPFFHFAPSGLHVERGDVVQFTATDPDHTVTAYHPGFGFQRRVPEEVPPFSSPVLNAGGAWLYEFEETGVYDMYCGPHHVLGMVMRIVSGDVDGAPAYVDTFEGRAGSEDEPPLLAPFSKEFLEHELNATSDANEDC
jgi:plastocyanin